MFDWIKKLFTPKPSSPWLTDGAGHDLRWAYSDMPVNVYLDRSLLSVDAFGSAQINAFAAIRWLNANVNRQLFLLPVSPSLDTLLALGSERGRLELRQTILVTATEDPLSEPSPSFCHTDLRFDVHDGAIRNAKVDWLVTGDRVNDTQTLAHEIFHCLGVGHQAAGIMAPKRKRGPWEEPSSELFEMIKRKYQ